MNVKGAWENMCKACGKHVEGMRMMHCWHQGMRRDKMEGDLIRSGGDKIR